MSINRRSCSSVLSIGVLFATIFSNASFAASSSATADATATPAGTANQTTTVDQVLDKITPDEPSAVQQKLEQQKEVKENSFAIALFRPTYVLPFYYTGSPYQLPDTPDNQRVMSSELKAQLSLALPLAHFWQEKASVNIAYTQVSYWQVYAKSQYFRETNYEPELFFSYNFHRNWLANIGLDHQSNGKGGDEERSWNRAYLDLGLSGEKWSVSIKPWLLIFQGDSITEHNPDIADYLGHERMLFAYKPWGEQVVSLSLRNTIDSGFRRGAEELTWSIPLGKTRFRFYVDLFSGYGQSLIEYNHYTNAAGVGFALNDWI